MKLKLQATEWTIGKGVTFDEFFGELDRWSKNPDGTPRVFRFESHTRLMAVRRSGDFWIVLLMTQRDHRRQFKMRWKDDGFPEVSPHDIGPGDQGINFNYLLVHRETGRGVYAHYQYSCHFDDITSMAREVYDEWKGTLVERAAEVTSEKRARRQYAGTLRGILLVSPQEIRQLVESFQKINTLELAFGEVQVDKGWGQPLHGLVRVARHSFRFLRDTPLLRLRESVIAAIYQSGVTSGKVVGEGEDRVERAYQLKKNAGTFEQLDFDDVTQELQFDFRSPENSVIVRKMQDAIGKRPDYFIRPTKESKKPEGKEAGP